MEGGGATDTEWNGPELLLDILQCTGQPLTTKNDVTPNANSAEAKKLWARRK